MPDEPELDRVARRESVERVRRLQATLAESRWREVYRDAHTLAGIAPDPVVAEHARALASLVSDARGRVQPPSDPDEARRVGRLLFEGAAQWDQA